MIEVSDAISAIFLRNQTVCFDPLHGNHGDKLIEMGSLKNLASHGRRFDAPPNSAEAIIINGSGSMNPMYQGLSILKEHIASSAREVLVLPSTFWPERSLGDVRELLRGKQKRVTLFARDTSSYRRLLAELGDFATISIGNDMAFQLTRDDINPLWGQNPRVNPYVLIVERRDTEASTDVEKVRPFPIPLKRYLSPTLKRPIKRFVSRIGAGSTSFAKHCLEIARSRKFPTGRVMYADVSDTSLFTFDEFMRIVVGAEIVFTTRLHVAILRHLVGLPCYLRPTGKDYRKNEDVFEYSMRERGVVQLMEP